MGEPDRRIPPQAGSGVRHSAPGPAGEKQPPGKSEATRLLSAGAFLDAPFRRSVIGELVEHRERPVPPSLGIDLVPILGYALKALIRELRAGVSLLGVWTVFLTVDVVALFVSSPAEEATLPPRAGLSSEPGLDLLPDLPTWLDKLLSILPVGAVFSLGDQVTGWVGLYATAALLLYGAGRLANQTERRGGTSLRVVGWVMTLLFWCLALSQLLGGRWSALPGILLPLALSAVVWRHRTLIHRTVRRELGRETFPNTPEPLMPSLLDLAETRDMLDREQHGRLIIYHPETPFLGAGSPYEPWSLALELRHREPNSAPEEPPTSREVLDLIKPRLEALRHSAAMEGSRDRLRELEIDEVVYLPPGPAREEVPHDESVHHLTRATNEGAEARRHFLRVRISTWNEMVVLTLLIRVHTQGGMLVLEVIPHVLPPVRSDFGIVDTLAGTAPRTRGVGGALRLLFTSPAASVELLFTGLRALRSLVRAQRRTTRGVRYGAPHLSVRELGAMSEQSRFQSLDVSRYTKTLQDRIASGVRHALHSRGYATGDFDEQIVHVAQGGVFISGGMSGGAVSTGDRGKAADQRTYGRGI